MKAQKLSALLALALLLCSFTLVPTFPASAQSSNKPIASIMNVSQVLNLTADPQYSLFSLNAAADISASINGTFSGFTNGTSIPGAALTSAILLNMHLTFKPTQISAEELVNNSLIPLQVLPGAIQSGFLISYSVNVSSGATGVNIFIQGRQTGDYFLGRYVSQIPFVGVNSPNILVTSRSQTNLFLPGGSIISQAYGHGSASVAPPEEPIPPEMPDAPQGGIVYQIPPTVAVIVAQSVYYVPLSIVLTILAILLVAFAALGFFSKGIVLINRIFERIRRLVNSTLEKTFALLHLKRSTKGFSLKAGFRSKNLLVLFIICGFLMISIAALSGPNPTITAYALAPNSEISNIQSSLKLAAHGKPQIVSPNQDYSDFGVMSSIGMFKVFVVSDFPSVALREVSKFIIPNINNVPIVVLTATADPTFVSEIKAVYTGPIINMSDVPDLAAAIAQVTTPNALGLHISNSSFKSALEIEAGLSFLLVLIGWTYLGAKITEPSSERSLWSISSVILSGIFIFYISEVLYVITSATMNFPLSLHAVLSGAETITAVGLFGQTFHIPLGGGSTPRLLLGLFGILLGGFVTSRGKMFSKRAVAMIIGISVILVVNPLAVGQIVFQGLLLFVGNVTIGNAYASSLTVKGFLYAIGSALGGTISPVYLMSAGKMLYFAGLVPLAFVKKMGRVTATFTFLLAAVFVGDGGVRVGEMTPDKTVVAVVPGLIAGVIIASILLFFAWLERYLSTVHARSRF